MTIGEWWRRVQRVVRRDQMVDEMDEEIRLHIELRMQKNVSAGMSPREAAYAARRRFGNPTLLREEGREAWGWLFAERFAQDVRYGLRQLLRNPMSTIAVVLVLALGIGANTAMFTLLNAVLFAPAPVANPERLVWLGETAPSGRFRGLSYPDYLALRAHRDPFDDVVAFSNISLSLGGGTPERIRGFITSANYFDVLGVQAELGRTFSPDEDTEPGAHPVVVLSDALWRRRYGADRSILNQSIIINGRPFAVIGIARRGFAGVEINEAPVGLWVPIAMVGEAIPGEGTRLTEAGVAWLRVVGRIAPGVSVAQANARVQTIELPSRATQSASAGTGRTTALPVAGGLDPPNRRELAPVLALLALVPALVLLIACANGANLLLARGVDRRKELALRRSLGASRGRLVRQLLTESVMLGSIAGGLGIGLAYSLLSLIGRLGRVPPSLMASLTVDARVLVATLVVAMATGLLFGLAPALAISNPLLAPALKEDGVTLTAGRRRQRLQGALVVAQVAVSVVLLVATGLFLRSMSKSIQIDPGFDTHRGLALSFDLDLQGYKPAARDGFTRQLLERTAALPGVESSAVTTTLPLGGWFTGTEVTPEGGAPDARGASTLFASVSPAYFATMGIPVARGRAFSDRDTATASPVVILNQSAASQLWSNANPLGKRLRLSGNDEPWREVVGVVGDAKDDDLTGRPRLFLYLPLPQLPTGRLSLVVRTSSNPRPMLAPVAAAAHGLDPNLPLVDVRTFEDLVSDSVDKQRAASSLLAVFGVIALMLATLGIYGVTAHTATLRTREVGIRMALGARTADVHRLFIGEGLVLSLTGGLIGLVSSLVTTKLIAGFLFGVGPSDAVVFAGVAVVLGATTLLASYLPARRAAHLDPLAALRAE
jgi:putative ABC transport system permease protein